MQPPVSSVPRIEYVDNVKAIAMVLVVVGHAPGLNPFVMNFIYAFHMPVFFFLSGLLLSEQKLALPLRRFIVLQVRGLGIPYLFFFLLSYLYWLPTHRLAAAAKTLGPMAWWEPLLGLLMGNQHAWVVNAVLWFFLCLFMTTCIYFIAKRFFSAGLLALVFSLQGIVFALFYVPSWPRWPWALDSTLIALGFYAAGHFARAYYPQLAQLSRPRAAILVLVLGLVLLAGTALNGKVDLNSLVLGNLLFLYFVNAYIGIVGLWLIGMLMPSKPVLTWIANHTIIIFPTHLLLYSLFTGIAVIVLGWPHNFKESSWIWAVVFPALALGLSYPISIFLGRCCPILFGNRGPNANTRDSASTIAPRRAARDFTR
jgi:acyltransferase